MRLHFPTDITLTRQEVELYCVSEVIRELVYELGVFAVGRTLETPHPRPFQIWEATEGGPAKCLAAVTIDGMLVWFDEEREWPTWEQ